METLNVNGLSETDVKLLKDLVERLKAKAQERAEQPEERPVQYRSWPLGVKGEVTRKDIYDYL